MGHFLPLDPPNNPKNEKKKWKNEKKCMKILWFYTCLPQMVIIKEHDRQKFLSYWTIFLPFYPPNNPQNQNFEKMKAMPGDVILQKCTKNHDHILYCSWDMACDGRIVIFYFGLFFDFLPPLTVQKINIWKKMNKTYRDIIILHKCTKNHNHMLCCSWDMTHDRCNCYFSSWAIFCPYTL